MYKIEYYTDIQCKKVLHELTAVYGGINMGNYIKDCNKSETVSLTNFDKKYTIEITENGNGREIFDFLTEESSFEYKSRNLD